MKGLVARPMGGRRWSADVALPAPATCLVLLLAMAVVAQAEDGLVRLGTRRTTTEDGGGGGGGGFGKEGSGGVSFFHHPAARLHASGLVRLTDGPESLWLAKKGEGEEEEEEDWEKTNVDANKRLTVAVQLQRGSGHPLSPSVEITRSVGETSKTMSKNKKQDQVLHRVGKEACGPVIPALETPDCDVEADDGQGYQLRKYPSGRFWTVATVKNALNYDLAVLKGFLACFNYISGHNSRNEVIEMTGPVRIQPLEDVKSSTSNVKTVSYKIAFFVPSKYKTMEDLPLPTVPSIISFEEFTPGVKAVYGPFGGFPDDKVYQKKWDKLKAALDKDGIKYDESTLMFAGYSSPFEFLNRKQEVWVDVISSSVELAGSVANVEEKEE